MGEAEHRDAIAYFTFHLCNGTTYFALNSKVFAFLRSERGQMVRESGTLDQFNAKCMHYHGGFVSFRYQSI